MISDEIRPLQRRYSKAVNVPMFRDLAHIKAHIPPGRLPVQLSANERCSEIGVLLSMEKRRICARRIRWVDKSRETETLQEVLQLHEPSQTE